jgi:hypothetical protein
VTQLGAFSQLYQTPLSLLRNRYDYRIDALQQHCDGFATVAMYNVCRQLPNRFTMPWHCMHMQGG